MIAQKELKSLVEMVLEDHSLFLVEAHIGTGSRPKITIILDGDDGVMIDQCASVSRKLGGLLEEAEIGESPYQLEVSSPGIGQKLSEPRQFRKHVGRDVEILMKDSSSSDGKLTQLADEALTLEHFKEVHKGKFKSTGTTQIALEDIDYLKVKAVF